MKNFIQSKIVNKSLILQGRDEKLVDSTITFGIVELFETLTVLLLKSEVDILKCNLKLPGLNDPFILDSSKLKNDLYFLVSFKIYYLIYYKSSLNQLPPAFIRKKKIIVFFWKK